METLELRAADLVHISIALEDRLANLAQYGTRDSINHVENLLARWDKFLADNELPESATLVAE
jgi:hypothetical protein